MKSSRAVLLVVYAGLAFFALLTLVPFAWMLCAAFKSNADFFSSTFLPAGKGLFGIAWERLTLDNFRRLFAEFDIVRSLANSIFLASATSLLGALSAALGGYALARFRFPGKKITSAVALAAILIPGPLLIAPGYQWLYQLGLLDSYAAIILPAIGPAFGVFLFRQACIRSVPQELIEAARIDGACEIRIFFSVALPLLRPMTGAFLMLAFLGTWNNFLAPQILLQTPSKFPLSVAINQLKGLYNLDYGLIMAGTLISVAPVLCLFLLLQKEFVAGLTSGSVKE